MVINGTNAAGNTGTGTGSTTGTGAINDATTLGGQISSRSCWPN